MRPKAVNISSSFIYNENTSKQTGLSIWILTCSHFTSQIPDQFYSRITRTSSRSRCLLIFVTYRFTSFLQGRRNSISSTSILFWISRLVPAVPGASKHTLKTRLQCAPKDLWARHARTQTRADLMFDWSFWSTFARKEFLQKCGVSSQFLQIYLFFTVYSLPGQVTVDFLLEVGCNFESTSSPTFNTGSFIIHSKNLFTVWTINIVIYILLLSSFIRL